MQGPKAVSSWCPVGTRMGSHGSEASWQRLLNVLPLAVSTKRSRPALLGCGRRRETKATPGVLLRLPQRQSQLRKGALTSNASVFSSSAAGSQRLALGETVT